jgi:hypothetical protein
MIATRQVWMCALVVCVGCAAPRAPVSPALRDAPSRTPVVLIPGTTGSQLRDRETGRIVWGRAMNFFLPLDGGYELALPLEDGTGGPDRLEPADPVDEVRLLGVFRIEVYRGIKRLMRQNGYRLGDLRRPRAEDDFFVFTHDWRRDNLHAVGELAGQLEGLRRARGEPQLRVVLVCHSDGAHIGRYFAKYGGVGLEDAEAGRAVGQEPAAGVQVEKLILIGTANGGAIGMLELMNRGRVYLPLLGRRWRPEVFFTMHMFYQHLPVYREDMFFDRTGQRLDIDLFDPANWERYQWSIHAPATAERLRRRPQAAARFGSAEQQAEHLRRQLDRGRRLNALLMRDAPGFGGTRYYLLQNAYDPTPDRALLRRANDRWETLFVKDSAVRRNRLWRSLAAAPGDGYATLDSQMWLSPQERGALARPPLYIDGGHMKLVTHPGTHYWLLEALADPAE